MELNNYKPLDHFAKQLGVSRQTLLIAIRKGIFSAWRVGRTLKTTEDEIKKYVEFRKYNPRQTKHPKIIS